METAILQDMCIQASEQGEYVILLGDFNVDETGTERFWNPNIDLHAKNPDIGVELDEKELFVKTKERFLELYYRGVNPKLPTNVYPFLSGGDAEPAHNDDIWIPQAGTLLRMDKPVGILNKKGNRRPGKVHQIPEYVLVQWDKKTRAYFDSLDDVSFGSKKVSRRRLNNLLSKLWSDHRPLSVTLKQPPLMIMKKVEKKKEEEEDALPAEEPIVLTLTQTSVCVIPDEANLMEYFQEQEIAIIRKMKIKECLSYEMTHNTMLKTLHMDGSESAEVLWEAMTEHDFEPTKVIKVFWDEPSVEAVRLVKMGGELQDCGKEGCVCDMSFMRRIEEFIQVESVESVAKE